MTHFNPTTFLRKARQLALCLVAAVFASPGFAQHASDIDIYSGGASSTDAPNVLFVIDNTANWNSAFANEVAALISAFNSLPAARFRVGMMMFTETGGGNSGADGGYVRTAVRLLDAPYKLKLASFLNSLDSTGDKSNGGKAGATMAEAYYYFAGQAPVSGNNKVKTDYAGNTSGAAASNAVYATSGNALSSKSGSPYVSPVASACAGKYIIYISNGTPSDNSSDNTAASTALTAAYAAAGMSRPADISVTGVSGPLASNVADEWARFMKASPQNITTYTLDVNKVASGQGPNWSKLLKSMASASGGEYFDVAATGSNIANALSKIFNKLNAVDSAFASASLPVSVNARGTYLNQIYMGMFRPDANSKPRWVGNLKQYKFGFDPVTDTLFLTDSSVPASGQSQPRIVSEVTGFIDGAAKSYWTADSTFWATATPTAPSDSPDGPAVERGGAAQMARTAFNTDANRATRKVYTCLSCAANTNLSSTTSAVFNTTNAAITNADLGVASAERDDLINWVRGANNLTGDELAAGDSSTVRPSLHGDVLHSRPAVVNYGGSTGVVVFYGANDGMLRAINGNQTGAGAGGELWSFIPEEHLTKLNRLRSASPLIRLSTTVIAGAPTPTARDYFVDGPIAVYQKGTVTAGVQVNEKVYIYVGMRRGGRTMYAIDVTNPATPIIMWKKTNADISVLGQTWSEPKLAKIKGHANPVLILGAGYDAAAEDAVTPGTTTMGNAVLVLDAFTGALLKKFDTTRSVPADVALIDSDSDGFVDRVYAVDAGGNAYRIDLESSGGGVAVSDWTIYTLATLGSGATRKFFFAPDVVITSGFTALLMGTGDREKPLDNTSSDRFFTVKDPRKDKGAPATIPSAILPTELGLTGSAEDTTKGCYIAMGTDGEKIVNAATSVGGITYFSTNKPMPPSNSCTGNLGQAKVYAAPLFCKVATTQVLTGGGLPPSPVSGVVAVTFTNPVTNVEETRRVTFIIGGMNAKKSGIEGSKVTPPISPVRTRRYWYLDNPR